MGSALKTTQMLLFVPVFASIALCIYSLTLIQISKQNLDYGVVNSNNFGILPTRIINKDNNNPQQQQQNHNRKRVFVCITGQVQRLILRKKIQTWLGPMIEQGYDVDIAIMMSDSDVSFRTNKDLNVTAQEFYSFNDVVTYLSQRNFSVLNSEPLPVELDPLVPDAYIGILNKKEWGLKHFGPEYNLNRGRNHARQYSTIAKCGDVLQSSMKDRGVQYYDAVMRIREDMSFEEQFDVNDVLPIPPNTILTPSCRCWFGINDRFAIASPDIALQYFALPSKRLEILQENPTCTTDIPMSCLKVLTCTKDHDDNKPTTTIPPRCLNYTKNPETYNAQTYLMDGIDVISTSRIPAVIKYVTSSSNKTKVAKYEDRPRCDEIEEKCPLHRDDF